MKKCCIWIFLLLLVTPSIFAALPTSTPIHQVGAPCYRGGFNFGIAFPFWQPTFNILDYALSYPHFDSTRQNAPFLNEGTFKFVDPTFHTGLRVSVGYVFPCTSNDVLFTANVYSNDRHDEFINLTDGLNLFAVAPLDILLGISGSPMSNQLLLSVPLFNFVNVGTSGLPISNQLSLFVPLFNFANVGTVTDLYVPIPVQLAEARARFKFQNWNLDAGQRLYTGHHCKIRLYAGLQVASLGFNFNSRYAGLGVTDAAVASSLGSGLAIFQALADFKVFQRSQYDGAGPKVGTQIDYYLGNGFGLTADCSMGALLGEVDSSLSEEISYIVESEGLSGGISGIVDVDTSQIRGFELGSTKHAHIVPNINAKLALNYTYETCFLFWARVTAELGYEVLHYWNSFGVFYEIPDANRSISINSQDSISVMSTKSTSINFAGPYFSLQIQL